MGGDGSKLPRLGCGFRGRAERGEGHKDTILKVRNKTMELKTQSNQFQRAAKLKENQQQALAGMIQQNRNRPRTQQAAPMCYKLARKCNYIVCG